MSSINVYLKPFDGSGNYLTDWIDITKYVNENGFGSIKRQLDNTEYDVGVFRTSNLTIKLWNGSGLFADIEEASSYFRYKRRDSKVKITWSPGFAPSICGFAIAGSDIISEEIDIFEGLLVDDATKEDIQTQLIDFKVLGYEQLFTKVSIPYGSIANGDSASTVIYTILNQSAITSYLTVSSGNISVGTNQTIDDKTKMEGKTVMKVLQEMLLMSNSVLYLLNNTVYVSPRTESSTLMRTFYGQSSKEGNEDILDLNDYRTGLNRVYNYWRWSDSNSVVQDASSVTLYGVISKEIKTDYYTNSTKITNILTSFKDEFRNKKKEIQLVTYFDVARSTLKLLDKVNIDYPQDFVPSDDLAGSRYDAATSLYDTTDRYAATDFVFGIRTTTFWKIMAIDIDLVKQIMKLDLREV